jgi:transposase InsO family protein
MEKYKDQFSITAMCRVLGVSKSGYYSWTKRPESQRSLDDDQLGNEIERLHKESKQSYGSPRIHAELRSNGIRCGRKRVARLMQDRDLRPKRTKKFKVTTDSGHKLPVAENLLDRQFEQQDCNQSWAADITYRVPGVHEKQRCFNEPRVYLKYINKMTKPNLFTSMSGCADI